MAGLRTVDAWRSAAAMVLSAACASACVEVPDNIRAHFADPRAEERSNYRKGLHGSAPPNDEQPAVAKASAPPPPHEPAPAPSTPAVAADGGAP